MQQLGGNQGVQGVPSICTIQLKIFSEKFQACKEARREPVEGSRLGYQVKHPQSRCTGFSVALRHGSELGLGPVARLRSNRSTTAVIVEGRGCLARTTRSGVFYIELSSKNCSTQIPLTTQKLFYIDTTHYLKNCSIQKPHTSQEHSSYNYIFI